MAQSATANILTVLDTDFKGIIEEWLGTQVKEGVKRSDLFSDAESRAQNRELLKAFSKGHPEGAAGGGGGPRGGRRRCCPGFRCCRLTVFMTGRAVTGRPGIRRPV